MMNHKNESIENCRNPLITFSARSIPSFYEEEELGLNLQPICGNEDNSLNVSSYEENFLQCEWSEMNSKKIVNQPHNEVDEIVIDCKNNNEFELDMYDEAFPYLEVTPLWLDKELRLLKSNPSKSIFENVGLCKTENSTVLLNESEGRCQTELLIKKTKGDSNDDSKIKNKRIRKKDMHKCTSDNTYHKNSKIKFISFNENSKFEVLKISKHSNELSLIKSEELESLISENFEISNKEIILTENSFDQPIDEICIQETKIINSKIKKRQRKLKSKLLSENKLINFTTTSKTGKLCDKPKYKKRTKLLSSGESSSTEEIDLARRRDVVNKTILRILRRYLAQQFKLHVPQVNEEKVNKRQVFFKNIKEYAIKIFGESNPELNILHFYLASMIDPKFINESDIIESNANISDVKTFYDCLYKYSHTRLVNLFEVKPIGKIYEYFYEQAKDSILESEEAVIKNKELYSQVLKEFLLIFQGKIDISTLII